MAITVVFDGTRVSGAESETDGGTWDEWDSGKSPSEEPDFYYQEGAGTIGHAISLKVGTSEAGVELEATTAVDYAGGGAGGADRVVLFKSIATNFAALNVVGATGMVHYIGSGTTTDRYNYYTHGSDQYPLAGGFVFDLIDPNIAAYRSATDGTPNLNAVNYYGLSATFVANSKAENIAMDAIDYFDVGTGLTLTGNTPDGDFDDFVSFDEGTISNRYGIVRTVEGILYVLGTLRIGTTAAETDFTDETGGTMVFPDSLFGPGTSGIVYDIGNASSIQVTSDWSFVGRGSVTNADSRPDYTVTGAGASATATFNGCSYRVYRNWTMNAKATFNDCLFADGLLVTQNSAVIDGCSFTGGTNATNTALMDCDDPENITNTLFEAGAAGHAMELSPTGNQTYTFDNIQFTSYTGTAGSAALWWNPTGGTENLIINVTNTPANAITTALIRNSSTGTVTVNNSVTLELTGIQTDSEVRLINLDNDTDFNKELDGIEQVVGEVVSVEIADGGSGYSVNDVLTVVGGTGTAATITVTSVSTGVVTGVSITTAGAYTANPANPVATTSAPSAGRSGCTLRLTIAGTFSYSYDSSFTPRVAIIVFHIDYTEVRIEQNLASVSQSIPIQQRGDRVYNNP